MRQWYKVYVPYSGAGREHVNCVVADSAEHAVGQLHPFVELEWGKGFADKLKAEPCVDCNAEGHHVD